MKFKAGITILLTLGLMAFFAPGPVESLPADHSADSTVQVAGNDDTTSKNVQGNTSESSSQDEAMEEEASTIPDPLEPMNRVFFKLNDKLYFWILRPTAQGYKKVVPEGARVSVSNFVSNVTTPIRFVNCLLQFRFKGAGKELARLVLNSTFGVGGLFDVAKDGFHLTKQNADFGQTLGVWGVKPIFFIEWPFYGPSNVRDTIGMGADAFLDPHSYFLNTYLSYYGVVVLEKINGVSLILGEYEDLVKASLDPYVAVRDAYAQYRENKIKQR